MLYSTLDEEDVNRFFAERFSLTAPRVPCSARKAAATQACQLGSYKPPPARLLSLHCLCGQRVEKTLSGRIHYLPAV